MFTIFFVLHRSLPSVPGDTVSVTHIGVTGQSFVYYLLSAHPSSSEELLVSPAAPLPATVRVHAARGETAAGSNLGLGVTLGALG